MIDARGVAAAFEIVPGRSIGPVRLGMTRAEVDVVLPEGARAAIQVTFSETGVCCSIAAEVPWDSGKAPLFSLAGQVVNGALADDVDGVFRSLSNYIWHFYGSTHAPSIGLSACRWEAGDSVYHEIEVQAPEPELPPFFEITPGRSIGSVQLGMSREELEAVQYCWFIRANLGKDGVVSDIEAIVPAQPEHAPFFRLAGRIVNGLSVAEVDVLLESFGAKIERLAGWVALSSIGLGAALSWDGRSYDKISVRLPDSRTRAGRDAARSRGPSPKRVTRRK